MSSQQHNIPKRFHHLSYGQALKKAGVNSDVADIHVEAAEGIVHDIVHHSELVTKTEFNEKFTQLDQEIKLLRKDMDYRFAQVDQKFEQVEQKMEAGFSFLQQNITLQITKITNKMLTYIVALSVSLVGSLITKGFHLF